MMDPALARLIAQATPDPNPDIAEGLAVKHLAKVDAHINSIWNAQNRSFPPGFQYVGLSRCDPIAEFNELTKPRKGKRIYNIAPSFLYMVSQHFVYNGVKIDRQLSLPFVKQAGEIQLSGSRFMISPVLADRVLSIERSSIFIRFGKGKVKLERAHYHYRSGNSQTTVGLVHGKLYNRKPKPGEAKPAVKGMTTLVHYLFCKYGALQTFAKFVGHVPVFGWPDEVNVNNYPEDKWVICQSAGIPPAGRKLRYWRPSSLRVAVPIEHFTETMKNYVGAFLYALDLFPDNRITPQFLDHTGMWRVFMGEILRPADLNRGYLQDNISDHIDSLDEYVDEVMRVRFRDIGIEVEDIYQFFSIINDKFNDWLTDGKDKINSLYYKELNVLSFLLEDVTNMINTFCFKLMAAVKSKAAMGRELKHTDIVDLMNKQLQTGRIYWIRKAHQEVNTTSCSGDNMAFKITSIVVPQDKASRQPSRGNDSSSTSENKQLHFSLAEIGGAWNMPKNDPSGHSRLNLYATVDDKGVVMPNPKFVELGARTGEKLRRAT
jgi:hypothetical protein